MAIATANDPYHSDMDGIKVDLGNSGDYAVADEIVPAKKAVPIKKVVIQEPFAAKTPKVQIDVQNEQVRTQGSTEDVPVVAHIKKINSRLALKPKHEAIPDGSNHLIEDERSVFERGTRPQAYNYGMPLFGQMPAPLFPLHNVLKSSEQLRAPDLECNGADCQGSAKAEQPAFNAIPQYQSLFPPGVFQMAQNQPPQGMPFMPMDMMKQMAQMMAIPQNQPTAMPQAQAQNVWSVPNLPQMMQTMPQMLPQMMQAMPQMMNQMDQSLLQQMPQVMQQVPQMMQQMPQMMQQMPQMMQQMPFAGFQSQYLQPAEYEQKAHKKHKKH